MTAAPHDRPAGRHLRRCIAILAGLQLLLLGASCASRAGADRSREKPGLATKAPEAPESARRPLSSIVEKQGIQVRCDVVPLGDEEGGETVRAGDDLLLRFEITDSSTGSPLSGLTPAVWVDPRTSLAPEEDTRVRIQSFLSGSLTARAEHDLNTFHVLALNDNATISVVDPLFSYGGSRLLAMVLLPSPGEDWALSADGTRLFVSMPLVNQVAVIDTDTWKISRLIDVAAHPTRIALQPDEKYLWVSGVSLKEEDHRGRVSVIDVDAGEVVTTLRIGDDRHLFAFAADSLHAYVGCSEPPAVTVIDAQSLQRVVEHPAARSLRGLAYSPLSRNVYAVDGEAGEILVIDGHTQELAARIEAPAGSGALSFDPGGRVGFIVNPVEDAVHILSAAKGAIVQTADVGPEPDQVTFTENLAYVRSLGSEIVLMIPLESVGEEGPVPVIDFSGGHVPFGLGEHPSAAAGIVPAPNGLAVLVANPIDKSIYYYAEGMAAPMGEFSNYGREARAVLVVDKSLKEASPGIYTTSVTIERSGLYGIYFLLDYPSLSHRFDLEVETGPLEKGRDPGPRLELTIEAPRGPVPPAEPVTLRFLARDPVTERPVEGIRDLGVLACRSSLWQKRGWARPVAAGVYEWTLTPPEEGIYLVFAQVPSHRFRYHETRRAVLRVENPGQDSTKSRNKDEKKSLPTSSR